MHLIIFVHLYIELAKPVQRGAGNTQNLGRAGQVSISMLNRDVDCIMLGSLARLFNSDDLSGIIAPIQIQMFRSNQPVIAKQHRSLDPQIVIAEA